jgi:hypothetical protein
MPVLRSVYRAGGAGANNTYTAHTKKTLNSNLLCVQYIYCWLRLRLLRHSVSGGEEPEPTTNIPRTRAK